jgi:hypothetical protein
MGYRKIEWDGKKIDNEKKMVIKGKGNGWLLKCL